MDFREYFIKQIKIFHKKGYDDFNFSLLNYLRTEAGLPTLKYVSSEYLGDGEQPRELYTRHFVKEEDLDKFISQLDNAELYSIHSSQLGEYYR